jgi:hypothetical protein
MKRGLMSPALALTIGLPLLAIAFSTGAAVIAFTRGDVVLPGEYHWEGVQLDHDFEASGRAAALGVKAQLWLLGGTCRLTLQVAGEAPAALTLKLVHGARPDLDRSAQLTRQPDGAYEGACGQVPAGLWHVELLDSRGSWSFMQDVAGSLDGARLSARAADSGPG